MFSTISRFIVLVKSFSLIILLQPVGQAAAQLGLKQVITLPETELLRVAIGIAHCI